MARRSRGPDIKPKQFRLPLALIKQIEHQAVEERISDSELAEKALLAYLFTAGTARMEAGAAGTQVADHASEHPEA
jgi:hypothetical protein